MWTPSSPSCTTEQPAPSSSSGQLPHLKTRYHEALQCWCCCGYYPSCDAIPTAYSQPAKQIYNFVEVSRHNLESSQN
jgi:hypothetical protein